MIKYLIGLGAVGAVVIGYFLLAPSETPPVGAPAPETPAPVAPAPVAPTSMPADPAVTPDPIVPDDTPTGPLDEVALLEEMAADIRESLPQTVTETLTLNDVLFLPRMRIMEFRYVTDAAATHNHVTEMQALIDTRAETICREGRAMFGFDVTLRNSFEDRIGNLFQRIYLLPEDCQRFY